MRLNRKTLMGTVAAVALGGVAMGVAPEAQAFNGTNWVWDQYIDEDVTKLVDITIDIHPVGLIDEEILQIQIGDVTSYSHVSHVYNWKPLEQVEIKHGYKREYDLTVDGNYHYNVSGNGSTTYQETESASWTGSFNANLNGSLATQGSGVPFFIGGVGDGSAQASIFPLAGGAEAEAVFGFIGAYGTNGSAAFQAHLDGNLTLAENSSYNYQNSYSYLHAGQGTFGGHLGITESDVYTIYTLAPALQDAALELPVVESTAVSVGNSISIESDVAVEEHSLQIVADTNCGGHRGGNNPQVLSEGGGHGCHPDFDGANFDLDADLNVNNQFVNVDSNNDFHDVAVLTTLAAGAGLLKKADIYAESTVNNILNAEVISTATAAGNVKTIELNTDVADNGLVMADISQVSIADVEAYSSVGGPGLVYALPVSTELQSADSIVAGGYGGIHLVNYNNLGGKTIASSTATAIGNAVNIKVNSGQFTPQN